MVGIVVFILTIVVLDFCNEGLNRLEWTPFEGIQKKLRYLKNKKLWMYISLVLSIMLGVGIGSVCGLTNIGLSIAGGICCSLSNILFENTWFDSLRNTLR